jgi:uncharacterized protein YndB with AHSA1/START domain
MQTLALWTRLTFRHIIPILVIFGAPLCAEVCAEAGLQPATVEVHDSGDGVSAAISARVTISAPRAKVWAAMLSCERALRYIEGLKACTILSRDPQGRSDVREHRIDRGWPVPAVVSVFRQDYEPPHTIRVARTGGDLKAMQGIWQLTELAGGAATEVSYQGIVALDTIVPGAILRPFVEADFKKILERMAADLGGRVGQ